MRWIKERIRLHAQRRRRGYSSQLLFEQLRKASRSLPADQAFTAAAGFAETSWERVADSVFRGGSSCAASPATSGWPQPVRRWKEQAR